MSKSGLLPESGRGYVSVKSLFLLMGVVFVLCGLVVGFQLNVDLLNNPDWRLNVSDTAMLEINVTNNESNTLSEISLAAGFNLAFLDYISSFFNYSGENLSPQWSTDGGWGILNWTFNLSESETQTIYLNLSTLRPGEVPIGVNVSNQTGDALDFDIAMLNITGSPIEMSKELLNEGSVSIDEMVSFRINITNYAPFNVTNLTLTDSFNSTYLVYNASFSESLGQPQLNDSSEMNSLTWNLSSIANDSSLIVYVNFTVESTGFTLNTASIENGSEPLRFSEAEVYINASQETYDLSLFKNAYSASVPGGYTASFLINLTNNKGSAADNILLVDEFNSSLLSYTGSYSEALGSPNINASEEINKLEWNLSSLAGGESVVVYVNFTALSEGSVTNFAFAEDDNESEEYVGYASANASINITAGGLGVFINKTLLNPGPSVGVAEVAEFEINITSMSETNLTDLYVFDTYNASFLVYNSSLSLASSSSISEQPFQEISGVLNWSLNLTAGDTVSIYVNFTLGGEGYVNNTAYVENVSHSVCAEDYAFINVSSNSSLNVSVIKTALVGQAQLGETVPYLINVTNIGGTIITAINITDSYDVMYLNYSNSSPAANSTTNGNLSWKIDTSLAPGDSYPVFVNLTVVEGGMNTTNNVSVSVSDSENSTILVESYANVELRYAAGSNISVWLLNQPINPNMGEDFALIVNVSDNLGQNYSDLTLSLG